MHLTAYPCKQMQTDLGKIPIERSIYVTVLPNRAGQGGGWRSWNTPDREQPFCCRLRLPVDAGWCTKF